jgi:RHS repeat-associated protein
MDQAGHTTQYAYDTLGRLASVTDALSHVTQFGYDVLGEKTSQTDANGHLTYFAYDNRGRLVSKMLPGGQFDNRTYDALGRLLTQTDFNGKVTAFVYDPLAGRLLSKTAYANASAYASNTPTGESVSFTYNLDGTRATATRTTSSGSVKTTYGYYANGDYRQGQLQSVTTTSGGVSRTISYSYDLLGNKTSMTTPSGKTISYRYDVLNRLSTVTHPDNAVTTFGYDKVGNRQSVSRATSATAASFSTTSYAYDALNRLTDIINANGSSGLVSKYHYQLRADGKRLSVTDGSGTTNYTYDDGGKLVQEAGPYATIAYGYDNVGNRLTRTVTNAATGNGTTLVNGVTTNTYDQNDRIATVNGSATHTYDLDGNEQTVNGQTASYDFENHLVSLGSVANYAYDADGNRTSASNLGTTTSYVVDTSLPYASVVEEYSGTTLAARYDYGDDLVRMDRGSGVYYYIYDGLGSTRQLVNTAGAVTDTWGYSAFGELASHTGGTVNPFLFNAQQFDQASGDYYLRARYYDQSNGRFISQDPYSGSDEDPVSLHRYLYASDDPVDRVDPGGQDDTEGETLAASSISSTLTGIVNSAILRVGALAAANIRVFYAIQTVNTLASLYMASQDPDQGVLYLTSDGFAADFELLYSGGSALIRGVISSTERILAYDAGRGVTSGIVDWGTGSGTKLDAAMQAAGVAKPSFSVAAHHIIPGNANHITELQQAKATLTRFGISANDAANGVYLPNTVLDPVDYTNGTPHVGSHNDAYYKFVGDYISGAQSKEEAVTRLQTIGELLKTGQLRLNKY